MGRKKELVKNTFILLFCRIFTQFLSFLLLPLYTRLISTSEYGIVDLVLSYAAIVPPILTLELEKATFRFLVDNRNNVEMQSDILKNAFRSMFIRILFVIFAYLIITIPLNFSDKYLILACGVVLCFSGLFLQIARGLGENEKYALGSIITGITTIICNLLFICLLGLGGAGILISVIIANAVCSVYLAISLRVLDKIKYKKASRSTARTMLKYSWPLVPNSLSWWLIDSSDKTIISILLGSAANGIYAVSLKFSAIIGGVMNVFLMSWTESASIHIDDEDRDSFFSSVADNTLRIFSSLSLLLIAMMPFVFGVIVGDKYNDAYAFIPIAILGVLMNCMISVYSAIYIAKKMTKRVAMTSFISAMINIIIDLALINFIGLYAAVISTCIAFTIMTIYRHFDVKKYVNIRYDSIDVILAILGFGIIIALYYINNPALNVTSMIVAIAYALLQNRNIIRKFVKR